MQDDQLLIIICKCGWENAMQKFLVVGFVDFQ